MSTTFEKTTLAGTPYFDDFDADKNFLRILSNPGRAIQSRELTQAQTILHNQISQFGNHLFKDGTSVIGGEIKLRQRVTITVSQDDLGIFGTSTPANASDFLNKHIRGLTSTALGKVVYIEENVNASPVQHRFHIAVRGGTFIDGEFIKTENFLDDVYVTQYETDNAGVGIITGTSVIANMNSGIYFVGGSFIISESQEIVINSESSIGQFKIGFKYIP